MAKNAFLSFCAAFFLFAACLPARAADDPLTVSGVTVDKTDKNAVLARAAAIAEARRAALRMLADRNGASAFVLPDDAAISTVVQDFEITNEQLSATRYVATFTVRFRDGVRKYVDVKATPPREAVAGRSILVLPYAETEAGKVLLWEDQNDWLKAWQATPPAAQGITITVPEGDVADVATGSTDAVWSGDYAPLEKLRQKYGADEVALAVANKASGALVVDLSLYRAGKLESLPSLTGAAESPGGAIDGVVKALLKAPAPAPAAPEVSSRPGVLAVEASMTFDQPSSWIEMQKRLSSLMPPPTVDIKSLSSGEAMFTLTFAGDLETLKSALAAKGVEMGRPAIEVDESVLGSARPTQTPVYELRLVN
jgi:hypothetical protein